MNFLILRLCNIHQIFAKLFHFVAVDLQGCFFLCCTNINFHFRSSLFHGQQILFKRQNLFFDGFLKTFGNFRTFGLLQGYNRFGNRFWYFFGSFNLGLDGLDRWLQWLNRLRSNRFDNRFFQRLDGSGRNEAFFKSRRLTFRFFSFDIDMAFDDIVHVGIWRFSHFFGLRQLIDSIKPT